MRLIPEPLIIDARSRPGVLPACPLRARERGGRPLFVFERTIYLETLWGWERIPRGYVTDWASIPAFASWLTLTDLKPLGAHAIGATGHDWGYAVGEPGQQAKFDQIFREQMKIDHVAAIRREAMYQAVHLFGAASYADAAKWWETANFANPETGEYPVKPPFRREEAFIGQRWGLRARPNWIEEMATAA